LGGILRAIVGVMFEPAVEAPVGVARTVPITVKFAFALLLLLWTGSATGADALSGVSPARWHRFQTVMWQTKTAKQYEALKQLGFAAALVQADRAAETEASVRHKVTPIVGAGLRPYVENIATDFYSAYHRWFPDKPVNAPFLELQEAIAADPNEKAVFIRRPSLSDPAELSSLKARITKIVRLYAPYRPLFFNLGDEMGIADLSAAWDFDFSAHSLLEMRRWLKGQYKDLAALNAEWATHFRTWEDVVPPTTTETMMRPDDNFAAWSDFKDWMDIAFARAIRAGSEAVHAGAPWALAGMEGAQMPGWGGYDYRRIASSVDVMELYDAGQSLELAQAFNPGLIALTTVDWGQSSTLYSAWHAFLRGVRGMIIWDANDRFVQRDGSLGPDGQAAAPFLSAMREAPAALIMESQRIRSPIAVLYSPRSYRLQWLLDHRAMGSSWTRLRSEDQNADNSVRAARRRVLDLLDSFGLWPNFVDEDQIVSGQLRKAGLKILILPQTLALSSKAAETLRDFVAGGGILITEGQAGIFDGHGRRLARSELSTLLGGSNPRAFELSRDWVEASRQLGEALRAVHITPMMRITDAGTDASPAVERYLYRNGGLTIAALLRKPMVHNGPTNISLPYTAYVYDVRAERLLTRANQFSVSLESNVPSILAISREPISAETCRFTLHWQKCDSINRGGE
jgi:hypothetical protein